MPIILDDFKLSGTILPIERICEIIQQAEDEYGSDFILPNKVGRPGVPELRLTKSYHAASQKYSNNRDLAQPKVYRTKTNDGFINTKRLVVVSSPIRKRHWQSYLVDVDPTGPHRFKLVNIGPKNGAITENFASSQPSWTAQNTGYYRREKEPQQRPDALRCFQTMNVRVNDGTGIINMIDTPIPTIDREWITPEESMRMYMRLVNYTELAGVSEYCKMLVAFCPIMDDEKKPKRLRWRSLQMVERDLPEVVIDLTRPDFPLNEQDRIFASLMWSEQVP